MASLARAAYYRPLQDRLDRDAEIIASRTTLVAQFPCSGVSGSAASVFATPAIGGIGSVCPRGYRQLRYISRGVRRSACQRG